MSARVLVVEDDAKLAAAVRRSLEYAGHAVTLAGDGPAGLAAAIHHRPELVVLDVNLPGLDGFGVCRALRAAGSPALVLMLTARDATEDRVDGLDAGADDYLVKPFAYEELLARVRALLRRAAPSSPVLRFADLVVDPAARTVHRGGREVALTALEFDLLAYLMRHPRQVLSRAQLRDAVWGGGGRAASNVVDVYVGYLRAKLEAGGEERVLRTVRGVGYVLRAGA